MKYLALIIVIWLSLLSGCDKVEKRDLTDIRPPLMDTNEFVNFLPPTNN